MAENGEGGMRSEERPKAEVGTWTQGKVQDAKGKMGNEKGR
jgi:hypothetical protein